MTRPPTPTPPPASELVLAEAVDSNHSLCHLTIDLRNIRARELIHNALSRNRDALRIRRRSATQ